MSPASSTFLTLFLPIPLSNIISSACFCHSIFPLITADLIFSIIILRFFIDERKDSAEC